MAIPPKKAAPRKKGSKSSTQPTHMATGRILPNFIGNDPGLHIYVPSKGAIAEHLVQASTVAERFRWEHTDDLIVVTNAAYSETSGSPIHDWLFKAESIASKYSPPKATEWDRRRREAIVQAELLLKAIGDALDHNPERDQNKHHISPLRIENTSYLHDLRGIQKRLNELITLLRNPPVQGSNIAERQAITDLHRQLKLFFDAFSPALGKGTAYLLVGIAFGIITHFAPDLADELLKHRR
jgi:hypothetical protein